MARRRRRLTWFPTLGTGNIVLDSDPPHREILLNVANNGGSNIITVPLTFDQPQQGRGAITTEQTPLDDFIGSEYIIERIVGNQFYNIATDGVAAGANLGRAILVTSGVFVARADDLDPNSPAGGAILAEELRNYSPASVENIREPWMFRRTWLLGAGPQLHDGTFRVGVDTDVVGTALNIHTLFAYPSSNVGYGNAIGGPHVDIKSSRRVRQDERLWWVTSAQNFPTGTATTGTFTLVGMFDYRILGQLVKARNSSSF